MYAGEKGTFIMYNPTNRTWIAKKKGSHVVASSDSKYEDLLFGTTDWKITGDNCNYAGNKVSLSLSTCGPNYFSCSSGHCLSLEGRCNGTEECLDGSDELNCLSVKLNPSYKHQRPPEEYKIMQVNVSVKVEDILKIKENENEFRARFKVSLYWQDQRITFYDLSNNLYSNEISSEDYVKIWRPKLAYRDMNIYHREINSDPFISVLINNYTYTTLDIQHLRNSKIFRDGQTTLQWEIVLRLDEILLKLLIMKVIENAY